MSDRTFRLILDGKKGGLVKGSSPSSAAKKVGFYTNSVKTGKSSIKFELQETTKGSKKKVYGPYKTKVKMAGGAPGNNKLSWDTSFEKYFPEKPVNSNKSLNTQLEVLLTLKKNFKNEFGSNNTQFNSKIANLQEQIRKRNLEGQQNSALPNQGLSTRLPPFVVNNSNNLKNRVNLSKLNKNFSGVSKNDLDKQLSTLINIQKRITKLYDEFSKEISKKKLSVINSLSELPKNTKPLSNITTLPSLRNTKINKSDINFANYNLQESLARGDIEQKFYELSYFYEKINELIQRIQETLKK